MNNDKTKSHLEVTNPEDVLSDQMLAEENAGDVPHIEESSVRLNTKHLRRETHIRRVK